MRILLLLFLVPFCFAADPEITRVLNLSLAVSCPGDILHINATASNGEPAADVELRLVRRIPYQGLRAVDHTDENGSSTMELTKTGVYRIYIKTEQYEHDDYVWFNYSKMCPPPPPKALNITAESDCTKSTIYITITDSESQGPVSEVLVRSDGWSSLTTGSGLVSFPLVEGWVYITANKSGYAVKNAYVNVNCTPPECLGHDDCAPDQYCANEECADITGECGFADNHTWFRYPCCSDDDCENDSRCMGHACVPVPPPPNITNVTNVTQNMTRNETEIPEEPESCAIAFLLIFFAILAIYNKEC